MSAVGSSNPDKRAIRKLSRYILQDSATNVCARLLLGDCENDDAENIITRLATGALQAGHVTLCAIFEERSSFMNRHYFGAYYIPFNDSTTKVLRERVGALLSTCKKDQHFPKHGLWITVDANPDDANRLAVTSPGSCLTVATLRVINRFQKNSELAAEENCIVSVTGEPVVKLQWVGVVTDRHREKLICQFAGVEYQGWGKLEVESRVTQQQAGYNQLTNNCGTLFKALIDGPPLCHLKGFGNVAHNMLKNSASLELDPDTYVSALIARAPPALAPAVRSTGGEPLIPYLDRTFVGRQGRL